LIEAVSALLGDLSGALGEIGYRLSLNWGTVTQDPFLSGIDENGYTGGLDGMTTFFNLSVAPLVASTGNLVADLGHVLWKIGSALTGLS